MRTLLNRLMADEAGFIISAELVLVGTISVLSMVVGLSAVATGVTRELADVGAAFGSINQDFRYSGMSGHDGRRAGSRFDQSRDDCDFCAIQFVPPGH